MVHPILIHRDRYERCGPEDSDLFLTWSKKIVVSNHKKSKGNVRIFKELCKKDGIIIEDIDAVEKAYLLDTRISTDRCFKEQDIDRYCANAHMKYKPLW